MVDQTNKELILDAIGRGSSFGADDLAEHLKAVSGAGTPTETSTIPSFKGQEYFDTANEVWYKAVDTVNVADFKQITN